MINAFVYKTINSIFNPKNHRKLFFCLGLNDVMEFPIAGTSQTNAIVQVSPFKNINRFKQNTFRMLDLFLVSVRRRKIPEVLERRQAL